MLTARRVPLGKTTEVARALPDKQIRMIGAWCFLDHYGPEDVSGSAGMQVWAHPHTGLQTVSWLLDGEIEHRDSLGSQVMVRPGELNIMTAGHGIVHSEISQPDKPPLLHGVQLWVALPDDAQPGPCVPELRRPARSQPARVRGKVLIGDIDGARSPSARYSPLCGADLSLTPVPMLSWLSRKGLSTESLWSRVRWSRNRRRSESTSCSILGDTRRHLRLRSEHGGRVIMLGGEPFAEDIVMWWNFIGRSHQRSWNSGRLGKGGIRDSHPLSAARRR